MSKLSLYQIKKRLKVYAEDLGDTVIGAGLQEVAEDLFLLTGDLRGRNVTLVRELENMSREYARLNSLYEILNRVKVVDDSDLTCWSWEGGLSKELLKVQSSLPEDAARELVEVLEAFVSERGVL